MHSASFAPNGNDKVILRDQIHREFVYRAFQFHERRQHFVRTHDKTLSVVAMCVNNPDRSPGGNPRLRRRPSFGVSVGYIL
jgi:hypothetical protein